MRLLKVSLVDGWTGLTLCVGLQDILFGVPEVAVTEAAVGVLEADSVNIASHGHNPVLSEDIGVKNLLLVGNKVSGEADRDFLAAHPPDVPLIDCLDQSARAMHADQTGKTLYSLDAQLAGTVAGIAQALERRCAPAHGLKTADTHVRSCGCHSLAGKLKTHARTRWLRDGRAAAVFAGRRLDAPHFPPLFYNFFILTP